MSDTGGFPLVGGNAQFPGKNNVVRDGSGSNSFGWENLNVGNLSVVGGYRNKATKDFSYFFGSNNAGPASFAFAFGASHNASGGYAATFGFSNTASGLGSFAIGTANIASGNYSFASGSTNTTSNTYASAFGLNNTVSGSAATALICGSWGLASRYGELAHGSVSATIGQHQHGWLGFCNQSTSATPINLYLDGTTATQNAVLGTGARWKCTAEIIATTTGAINKSASWEYKFQIDRPTNAASTIIRTTPLLSLSDGSNAGAPPAGWAVAITADTTNGCPQIQVTGDTDTINWTCCIHYIQSIRV